MGSAHSAPFNHPDLLVTFACSPAANCNSQEWYRCNSSGCCIGQTYGCFGFSCGHATDPGWVRNSPLRIELVDLLTDALKAMGGWPTFNSVTGCCFGGSVKKKLYLPPQLVEAFNKVCKIFNDAKLFGMGLQCRAIVIIFIDTKEWPIPRLLVLVEKRSDEHLHDVGQRHEHLSTLEGLGHLHPYWREMTEAALAWSPPEDWMTCLSPPYNESTNHV